MPDCERKEYAVSELIGAILLVGLVITAMAIVAVLLLSNPPPEEVPQLNALAGNDTTAIYLYHTGGDELKEQQTLIRINNNPTPVSHQDIQIKNEDGTMTTWAGSSIPWSVGKTLIIPSAETPQSVSIVYQGPTAQNLILTTSFAPSGGGTGSSGPGSSIRADFSGNPLSGDSPLSVQFTDQSTGTVTSYSWNFGDGGTSTSANPSHTYPGGGTFTVSLIVTGPDGSDTETKINYITVTEPVPFPVADFMGSPVSGNAPLVVQFTDLSTNTPTQWQWDVNNDGTIDYTSQTPQHTYSNTGTYTVTLTVSNAGGSDTHTKTGYITVTGPSMSSIYLNAGKTGSLQSAGYMEFRVRGPYSFIRHGATTYNLALNDIVRLVITDDGRGQIYATSSSINSFHFDNVKLYINGIDKGTRDIGQSDIWINTYDSYASTLTLVVPADYAWTQLFVNGPPPVINGYDGREIRIFNLRVNQYGFGEMNLNSRDNIYYSGGATGYQLI